LCDYQKLKAPKGFDIELYASGMPNARSMALGAKGTVFADRRCAASGQPGFRHAFS
jgi:hypothetical protein